jgi:hypothetical protein
VSGICSAHLPDVTDPDCPQCTATPADLFGAKRWGAMQAEAERADAHTCTVCDFIFYLTTPICPACNSTAVGAPKEQPLPTAAEACPIEPRCMITGNPFGSDTWQKFHPCSCDSCQKALRKSGRCAACAQPFVRGACHCTEQAARAIR